jgi:hypothetical protein
MFRSVFSSVHSFSRKQREREENLTKPKERVRVSTAIFLLNVDRVFRLFILVLYNLYIFIDMFRIKYVYGICVGFNEIKLG